MNYIPISWIEDYITYIKNVDLSVDEGSCLDWDEFIKNQIRDMVNTWEEEYVDDYVLCEKKREVIEKRPNGETIVKEYYVPVGEV